MPQLKDVRPGTIIKTVRGGSYASGDTPTERQVDELRDMGFDFTHEDEPEASVSRQQTPEPVIAR